MCLLPEVAIDIYAICDILIPFVILIIPLQLTIDRLYTSVNNNPQQRFVQRGQLIDDFRTMAPRWRRLKACWLKFQVSYNISFEGQKWNMIRAMREPDILPLDTPEVFFRHYRVASFSCLGIKLIALPEILKGIIYIFSKMSKGEIFFQFIDVWFKWHAFEFSNTRKVVANGVEGGLMSFRIGKRRWGAGSAGRIPQKNIIRRLYSNAVIRYRHRMRDHIIRNR